MSTLLSFQLASRTTTTIYRIKSENNGTEHRAQAIQNVLIKVFLCFAGQVLLGVHFSDAGNQELLRRLLRLVLDPLVVRLAQPRQLLQRLYVPLMLVRVVIELQAIGPAGLVQVKEHLLFTFVLAIVDRDGVVVLIEAAHFRNHAWRLQVTNV